jgi:hypothetical protein
MAKSKRNLSRKRRRNTKKRTRGKTRIVRRIHKIIGGATIENLRDIYDPEWNIERTQPTKMEEDFYDKQLIGHYKNVLIDGDENAGYVFKDLGSKSDQILGTSNKDKLLSIEEMKRRKDAGISMQPDINTKAIKNLYNYLQNQIHETYDNSLAKTQVVSEDQDINKELVVSEEPV